MAVDFIPLSYNEFLKSNNIESAWFYKAIERYDGYNWQVVYDVPRFLSEYKWIAYGNILQFQKVGNKILALGASKNAKLYNIINDSVSFIIQSYDNGFSWDTLWCDLPDVATTFYFVNNSIGWMGFEYNKIYKTTDGGISWFLQYSDSTPGDFIISIHAYDENTVYGATNYGKIIFSHNGGSSWIERQLQAYPERFNVIRAIGKNKAFLAGSDFYLTNDGGLTWQRVSKSLKGFFSKIDFVDKNNGFAINNEHIFKTTDGGKSWQVIYYAQEYTSGLDILNQKIGYATDGKIILKTTDGGLTWQSKVLANNVFLIRGVHFLNEEVGILFDVTFTNNDSLINYITTNGGLTWFRAPINNLQFVSSIFKVKFTDKNNLWFVNDNGVFLSKDTAKTWNLITDIGSLYSAFDFIDSLYGCYAPIIYANSSRMRFTTNGGLVWQDVIKPYMNNSKDVLIFGKDSNNQFNILVCGENGSLFLFKQGENFGYQLNSYTNRNLNSIASYRDGNEVHIWVAGDGMTLLYGKFLTTNVETSNPTNTYFYVLHQNYPNPFNPKTKIKFQVPKDGLTTLKVYDLLGREITTIVNEDLKAGEYEYEFDASKNNSTISSGMYFYQLKCGEFVQTKKMIFLK